MAKSYAVVTAIGADRVGIVDDLSGAAAQAGCNIEASKMAVLGGEFAVIMLVSGSSESMDALSARVPALNEKLSLRIDLKRTGKPRREESGRPYVLEAVSLDTPGIVHAVTEIIRRHGINIEDLETDTAAAPWTGAPMFRMKAHIIVASSVSVAKLKEELGALQLAQDLDISLKPVFSITETE